MVGLSRDKEIKKSQIIYHAGGKILGIHYINNR